ncbi:MAG: DegT/DnrJ/EryC1/StrS family aminotransferase [Candidatus Omnitrophota bacterium]
MKKIPLARPYFDNEEIRFISKCLKSGWVTQGPMVAEFERRFSELHEVKYSLAINSCTSALHLACLALGLKPGDEVIVPAFTWVSTANCVEYVGATVKFVDIDIRTYNIDINEIEKAITTKTKAIIVVHLFGLSVEMDKIIAIAKKYNLKIIEDAACAIGCKYNGKPVGGIGDIGCFSFHPRKIVTTGEGGMVTTNNRCYADIINSLRNHGTRGPEPGPRVMNYPYEMSAISNIGYNLRLSDIQGAVGIAQLLKLNKLLEKRKYIGDCYNFFLRDIDELELPYVSDKASHTYQSYVVRLKIKNKNYRNSIMTYLANKGVWTRPGTHAIPRLDVYKKRYNFNLAYFPNAILGEDMTISLPIYYEIKERELRYITNTFKTALCNYKI